MRRQKTSPLNARRLRLCPASRVKTSGKAALDARRTRRMWLGITNAGDPALVPQALSGPLSGLKFEPIPYVDR